MFTLVMVALSLAGTAASTYCARLFYLRTKDYADIAATCRSDASDYVAQAKAESAKVLEYANSVKSAIKADLRMSNDVMNYVLSTAASHKNLAETLESSTKAAAEKALDHATTASRFAVTAGEHERSCGEHRVITAEHVTAAIEHANLAASHADTAWEHARSVGALSVAVKDIASKTHIRLVTRTDYSTEGSNIGGR